MQAGRKHFHCHYFSKDGIHWKPPDVKEVGPVIGWFVGAVRGQLSLAFMSAHPPILLGNLGMTDSLILMVMALVVFGPRRLPQIGRQIGKLMYEFRKASNDFKFQMEEELRNSEEADRRTKEEERQRSMAALTAAQQASVSADPQPPAKTIESPYPGEGSYPPQIEAGEANTIETRRDESAPRIMPPSVGETVAAAKPSRATEAVPQTGGEAIGRETNGENAAAPIKPSSEAAEALNQHG